MFGRAGTELGLIHQVEVGWTTLHMVDVVLAASSPGAVARAKKRRERGA